MSSTLAIMLNRRGQMWKRDRWQDQEHGRLVWVAHISGDIGGGVFSEHDGAPTP